jgi:hypothetical protein
VRLQQQQLGVVVGKRKRSNREKSVEPEHLLQQVRPSASSSVSSRRGQQQPVAGDSIAMDCCDDDMEQDDQQSSSSSLSSSEWDEQVSGAHRGRLRYGNLLNLIAG